MKFTNTQAIVVIVALGLLEFKLNTFSYNFSYNCYKRKYSA